MTTAEQRESARQLANQKRLRIAELRRDVNQGRVTLAELLADPPPEILQMTLFDVIRMTYTSNRSGTSLEAIGRRALLDGVNLLVRVERSSMRSRQWVAENVMWQHRAQAGHARRYVEVAS